MVRRPVDPRRLVERDDVADALVIETDRAAERAVDHAQQVGLTGLVQLHVYSSHRHLLQDLIRLAVAVDVVEFDVCTAVGARIERRPPMQKAKQTSKWTLTAQPARRRPADAVGMGKQVGRCAAPSAYPISAGRQNLLGPEAAAQVQLDAEDVAVVPPPPRRWRASPRRASVAVHVDEVDNLPRQRRIRTAARPEGLPGVPTERLFVACRRSEDRPSPAGIGEGDVEKIAATSVSAASTAAPVSWSKKAILTGAFLICQAGPLHGIVH
jgi:hypothetical protein